MTKGAVPHSFVPISPSEEGEAATIADAVYDKKYMRISKKSQSVVQKMQSFFQKKLIIATW
ncbi:hypothetical protein ABID23_000945 [Bartonella silvatica]|uniref:Uncharacterized protein n=1 Tax=Bartonella silvatica TaxID=357760 RepID=A0ABV2HH26_9HYPH